MLKNVRAMSTNKSRGRRLGRQEFREEAMGFDGVKTEARTSFRRRPPSRMSDTVSGLAPPPNALELSRPFRYIPGP